MVKKIFLFFLLKIMNSKEFKNNLYKLINSPGNLKFFESKKIINISNLIVFPETSTLYPESKVYNFQKIKERILIGEHSHIRGELVIFPSGGEINIGNYCFIGENSKIWSNNNITIKDHVLISHNVNIHDSNAHPIDHLERRNDYINMLSSGFSKVNNNVDTLPILIEEDAWIGFNSIILKGVTIGKGAIVAAGSVVTKDVPSFTMVAGNPAKVIKSLK
jgi:acetyltransferase-like isoleucine patch superfamily enzyme